MNCKLLQGDCLELMAEVPENSIDLILCDLPYGTTSQKWDTIIPMNDYITVKVSPQKIKKMSIDDWLLFAFKNQYTYEDAIKKFHKEKLPGLWTFYNKVLKKNGVVCLFGQEPFSTYLRNSNLNLYKYDIYWEKERLTNIQQVNKRVGKTVETISVFFDGKSSTYNPQMNCYTGPLRKNTVKDGQLGKLTDKKNKKVIPYNDNGLRYPTQIWKYSREFLKEEHFQTQKPIKLIENIILTFSNEGDTVLDNTMGWGTTGRACVRTNRNFIGIEKNSFNFEKACEKIQEENIKKDFIITANVA